MLMFAEFGGAPVRPPLKMPLIYSYHYCYHYMWSKALLGNGGVWSLLKAWKQTSDDTSSQHETTVA